MVVHILIGLAALALGIYLGRPRRYDRTAADIERALDGEGGRQWAQRHFTPLDLLRKDRRGSHRRREERGRFQVTLPGDEKRSPDDDEGPPRVKLGR